MRIKYNILWIEDQQDWIDTTEIFFKTKLEELGFKLEKEILKNSDLIDDKIASNGFSDFDLILIDFKLGNSDTGNLIIDKIRKNEIFTDVLFYSQDFTLVKESLASMYLEGVYISDRNDIVDKFEKVMKTTIKKIQEVNTLRGLIMAETSEMDFLMEEILEKYLDKRCNNEENLKLCTKMIKKVRDHFNTNNEEFNIIEESNDGKGLINKIYFDSNKKSNSINSLLRIENSSDLKNIKKCNKNYIKEIIEPRNNLAHVKEEIEDGKKILVSIKTGNKFIFNENKCIEIRKNLIKHRSNLENLLKHINEL